MTTTKKMIITGAILFGVGAGICAAVLGITGFDLSQLSTGKLQTRDIEIEEDFNGIVINASIEDINVERSQDGKCQVIINDFEGVDAEVKTVGESLTITVPERSVSIWDTGFFMQQPNISIYLPKSEYGLFQATLATSDVNLPSDVTFGSIDIEVQTGDIRCKSSATGNISLEASTGDIDLTDVSAGSLNIKVSTGDIMLRNTTASGDFNISAITGDVNFDDADAANIIVTTSTGDVEGTLLSDKRFKTETGVGDVKVPDTDDGGKCEITTNTGDISLMIRE